MNKKIVLSIIILVALLVGGIYLFEFVIQKNTVESKVEAHLKEKGYVEMIQEKETRYDSKMGDHYIHVIYKDEPKNRYEYYVAHRNSPSPPVYAIVYDEQNVEIEDKEIAKYKE